MSANSASVDATADVETVQVSGERTPPAALPFLNQNRPPAQRLAIEGYAALCALCAEFPDNSDAMAARFQITSPASRQELDRWWGEHLARDAHDNQLFGMLYQQFRQWLRQHGAPVA